MTANDSQVWLGWPVADPDATLLGIRTGDTAAWAELTPAQVLGLRRELQRASRRFWPKPEVPPPNPLLAAYVGDDRD